MQKPWSPNPFLGLEPVDVTMLSMETRDHVTGASLDFVSLGFDFRGDYEQHQDTNVEVARYFQSSDGAVLGRINEPGTSPPFEYASILNDGTYVRSIPMAPVAPWNCCRFPVHVVFGADCDVEDLLVRHLDAVAELELGCGIANRYEPHRLEEVVTYLHDLMHETIYAQDAPQELLTIPQSMSTAQLAEV